MDFTNFSGPGRRPIARDGAEASHVRFAPSARCALDFPRRGCTLSFSAISHGNVLPNRGMQERHATGTRRAAAVRPALHAYAGEQLLRDAAGGRAWASAAGRPA